MHIFPTGPANHNTIVMSGSWDNPIAYSDASWTYWLSSNRDSVSRNRFVWEVPRSVSPNPKNGEVGQDAQFALLRFKLKSWIPIGSSSGKAQANIRAVIPGESSNHLLHVDEWDRGPSESYEGRRVVYTTAWLPISENDQIILDVSRGVTGRGVIEFVAYLEGYN